MEKGEGWLLLICYLCTGNLLYQNTATSCVFDIHRRGKRKEKPFSFLSLLQLGHFQKLVMHRKLSKKVFTPKEEDIFRVTLIIFCQIIENSLFPISVSCLTELTKAGCTVEGHIPDDSGTKTGPHQQELLGYLPQAPGPLPCHLERTFPWEKRGKGRDAGVELTPRSVSGLNPQERKTCQQVNYLICPQGHAFLLNYCLGSPRRCQGDQILQAHIWHIMDANGKLEDIINSEDCSESPCVRHGGTSGFWSQVCF